MHKTPHGGECCGIWHIHGMGYGPTENEGSPQNPVTKEARLRELIDSLDFQRTYDEDDIDDDAPIYNNGRVKEVVLADYQLAGWQDKLIEMGFKKVASFLNSNSENICHVFYHHPDLTLYGNEQQPGRPQIREVEVPVRMPIERSAVLVEYFPNFRVGGRGRPFSSLREVREHAPLVRRIDRRTVFNDGTVEWEYNVRAN
jgi:hypothetical protein